MAGRQKSIDTLQIKYDTAKHTVKQMKLLLAEALENIQTKDKETKTLRAQKDDFSNSLSNLRGDLKASQNTITHLKASEHNLLNKVKAMQRDLKDGFLLGEKIKGMDSSDQESEGFTQTLLGAVREQHAKAIERVADADGGGSSLILRTSTKVWGTNMHCNVYVAESLSGGIVKCINI